jgi:hypothetical protein
MYVDVALQQHAASIADDKEERALVSSLHESNVRTASLTLAREEQLDAKLSVLEVEQASLQDEVADYEKRYKYK